MSSYLVIRANENSLVSFSSPSKMYECCENVPFGYKNKEKITEETLKGIIEDSNEDIKKNKRAIDVHKELLKTNLTYEEKFDAIETIKDFEEDIEEIKNVQKYLEFLLICLDEQQYSDKPMEFYWFKE